MGEISRKRLTGKQCQLSDQIDHWALQINIFGNEENKDPNRALRRAQFGPISTRVGRKPLPMFQEIPDDECATVAQLVRALECGSRGRWFETSQSYHSPPRFKGRQMRIV